MTPAERIARIRTEIFGVAASYGVTSWEQTFMDSNKDRASLTPAQEETLRGIEAKVFGEEEEGDD